MLPHNRGGRYRKAGDLLVPKVNRPPALRLQPTARGRLDLAQARSEVPL
jgi:hypothetical protein